MSAVESSLSTPIHVIVVTPESAAVDTRADFVALPLFDGELGVQRGHSPMIGRLQSGELRIRSGEEVKRYYVDGGFVQVDNNTVTVLTAHVEPSEKVDLNTSQQQLETALKVPALGDEQIAIRDRQVDQARAKLRIARRAK